MTFDPQLLTAHHNHLRFKRVPEGYTRHKGKKMPCSPDEYVIAIIRTAQGFGYSGPIKAARHDWNPDNHARGLGAVVAYSVVAVGG